MRIEVQPEMRMTEATEPEVKHDPSDPNVIHVSYQAKVQPTGTYLIHITGATEAELRDILNVAKALESKREVNLNPANFDEFRKRVRVIIEEELKERSAKHGPIPNKTPPKTGVCKECRETKQVNSQKLCYKCHVEDNLKKRGWKPGTPHPDWCDCQGLGEHGDKGRTPGTN